MSKSDHIIGLHRKEGEEREENDFYATESAVIKPLLSLLNWSEPKVIRENSCGQGHLSILLEKAGHTVVSTDLIDRGYGVGGIDFLEDSWFDTLRYDAVVMNPPYTKKLLLPFIEKSLHIAPVVAAFLKIQFLEGDKRYETFTSKNPPKTIGVFINRVKCSKNATFKKGESNTQCYAWFIWERGFKGDPVVKFIRSR